MAPTPEHNERIAKMTLADLNPHYVTKVVKKGRTIEELHQVITWLTGYDEAQLQALIDQKVTFKTCFAQANLHPNTSLITGLICGYRIEELENPLTRQVRYLDTLVNELRQGPEDGKDLAKSIKARSNISTFSRHF